MQIKIYLVIKKLENLKYDTDNNNNNIIFQK